MHTPDFEVHRAVVHSSNTVTGEALVRIPALLGASQVVSVPRTGLTQVSGFWNVPQEGASTFVAVSDDRTQFFWLTAVTTPSGGDDRDVVDSLQFNVGANITVESEGLLAWNEDWGTVDIGLHGSNAVLHVGQQVYYYAKNQTGSQIDKGTVVRFDGALGASGHLKMAPFLADGTYPSEYIMGVTAHDIPAGDDGYVVHFGAVRGIDTATPGWSAGDVVYASPTVTGGLTSTTPVAPNNIILVAAVVNSHQNNGELFVRPTLAANILNDEGIVYTNLADNDLLRYNSTTGAFENFDASPTITLAGDATGSVTLTNLGNGTLTMAVVNDSHTHDGRYYTETESDSRFVNVDGDTMTGALTATSFSGSGASLTSLNASNISSGTFPDRFDSGTRYNIGYIDGVGVSSYDKLRVWNSSSYTIGMVSGITYGHLGDYAMTFRMNSDNDRGFWWGDTSHTAATGAMSLTTNGRLTVATSLSVGQGESITSPSTTTLYVNSGLLATGNVEAQGNLVVTRPDALMLAGASDNNHKIYSVNAADTGLPWSDGPVLVGHSGWGMYCEQENVWRMGLRGSNSNSNTRYGWYNCNLLVGSAPDDAKNTHTFRVQGNMYITSGIHQDDNGTINYFDAESKFRYESTSNDWSAQPVQLMSQYDIGLAVRSYNSDASTMMMRPASGLVYFQNHNDSAGVTLVAAGYSPSSMQYKQDIETWDTPKSVGAAVGPDEVVDATSMLKSLRPVTYRMDRMHYLSVSPQSERRREALKRLNVYRRSKGMKNFTSEELVHQCGRDCDGSSEEPCLFYRNWDRKNLGFVAEEAGAVSAHLTKEGKDGDNTLIDFTAVSATLVKAFQELETRLAALEGS